MTAMNDVRVSAREGVSEQRASLRVWISVGAGLIGAFMAVLNIQITNASLLDIEGGIGTGVDNGAWISTAYLIGEIIVIPLTDYLNRVFSFRIYAHVLGIERRGAICGGRDIGRYAVDLGAPANQVRSRDSHAVVDEFNPFKPPFRSSTSSQILHRWAVSLTDERG